MATVTSSHNEYTSEFTSGKKFNTNRTNHRRWIFSHVKRNRFFFVFVLISQIVMASGQAIIPVIIGSVFEEFEQGTMDRTTHYRRN